MSDKPLVNAGAAASAAEAVLRGFVEQASRIHGEVFQIRDHAETIGMELTGLYERLAAAELTDMTPETVRHITEVFGASQLTQVCDPMFSAIALHRQVLVEAEADPRLADASALLIESEAREAKARSQLMELTRGKNSFERDRDFMVLWKQRAAVMRPAATVLRWVYLVFVLGWMWGVDS